MNPNQQQLQPNANGQFTGTQADLQNWIKQNPNQDYQVYNPQGQVQSYVNGDRGWLGNILQGIAKPFVGLGQDVDQAVSNATGSKNQYLTQDQQQNGLRDVTENLAGVGSWLVPGMGGLGTLGKTLLPAALGAYSNQDVSKPIDPGSLALNTAIGTETGLLFHGLAGGGQPAANAVENTAQNAGEDVLNQVGNGGQPKLFTDLEGGANPQPGAENVANQAENATQQTAERAQNPLQKFGAGMQNWSEDQENRVLSRLIGKPKVGEGGLQLFNDLKDQGIDLFKGNDNAYQQISQKLQPEAGKLGSMMNDLADKGVSIDPDEVISKIQDRIDNAKTPFAKAPLQQALDEFKDHVNDTGLNTDLENPGTSKPIPIDDFYGMKQEWGKQAYTKGTTAADQTVANARQQIYNEMNSTIDKTLSQNGFEGFRAQNQLVHTLTQGQNFIERSIATKVPRGFLGVDALGKALVGGAMGGPGGAALGLTESILEKSPGFQKMLLNGVNKAGGVLENGLPAINLPNVNLPQVPQGVANAANTVQNVAAPMTEAALGNNNSNHQTMNNSTPDVISQIGGGATGNNIVAGSNNMPAPAKPQQGQGNLSGQPNQQQQSQNQQPNYNDPRQFAIGLMKAGAPYQEAQQMAYSFSSPYGMGAKLDPNQISTIAGESNVQNEVKDLSNSIEQNKGNFGPIAGRVGDVLSGIGANTGRSGVQAQISGLQTQLAQALTGSNSAESMKQVQDMLPSFNDTAEQAQAKLAQVYSIINSKKQTNLTADYSYGNPYAFMNNGSPSQMPSYGGGQQVAISPSNTQPNMSGY